MVKKRLQFIGIIIITVLSLSIELKSPPIREKNEKLRRISNQHFQQTELSNANNSIYTIIYVIRLRVVPVRNLINCTSLISSFIDKTLEVGGVK